MSTEPMEFRCPTCRETFTASAPVGATDQQLGDIFSAQHVCPRPCSAPGCTEPASRRCGICDAQRCHEHSALDSSVDDVFCREPGCAK